MNTRAETGGVGMRRGRTRPLMVAAVAVLIVAMAWDTTVVKTGADEGAEAQGFVAERFGIEQFTRIRESVTERAVAAPMLAEAVLEDSAAAGEQYGVGEGFGPVVPVALEGTFEEGASGIYSLIVPGVPDEITVRVQAGPAINGTDLRDATGEIGFGDFTNQIEYQNAGAAINDAMKAEVLAAIDTGDLSGRQVSLTGVFKLINPRNWLITPVSMDVEASP